MNLNIKVLEYCSYSLFFYNICTITINLFQITATGYSAGSAKAKAICQAKKFAIASISGQTAVRGKTTANCDSTPISSSEPRSIITC